jgi:hypothetical protein
MHTRKQKKQKVVIRGGLCFHNSIELVYCSVLSRAVLPPPAPPRPPPARCDMWSIQNKPRKGSDATPGLARTPPKPKTPPAPPSPPFASGAVRASASRSPNVPRSCSRRCIIQAATLPSAAHLKMIVCSAAFICQHQSQPQRSKVVTVRISSILFMNLGCCRLPIYSL